MLPFFHPSHMLYQKRNAYLLISPQSLKLCFFSFSGIDLYPKPGNARCETRGLSIECVLFFSEICAVSKISKKEIGRVFKLILKNLETNVELITTGDFMVRKIITMYMYLVEHI